MDKATAQLADSDASEAAVFALIGQLESHAQAAEWDEVEALTVRLRTAIMGIPASRRRGVMLAAQRSIDKVTESARSAYHSLSGKLSDLSRGKAAKKAYELR